MPTPIDTYLAALPPRQRAALDQLRQLLASVIPDAEEAIRTRVPALRYKEKTVVGFGAARSHLALYVMFGDALRVLKTELDAFDVSNRVVRFTPDQPIPAALIRKIVRLRLSEIDAQSAGASPAISQRKE